VQWPLTSGPRGGQPAKSLDCLAMFYVGLARGFVHTCLHEKGKAKAVVKVSGSQNTWLASHVARLADQHLVSYQLNQVSNPSLAPYKYPSIGAN
jgi:hypothetical protein